ncbi:MAG: nucleotidyltransferase family protein [Gammaproteobacteria bacterium]|jgi:MurNAc alpha-1-phosphate uridylyltransferase|nr:nucleotidyltransferase family protein [Gammaproteobacteria bacterium]|tara:strand:- start:18925 stop:19596 length:672 start_codon:yes stop_codon:yes gene_type:complete
MKAFILAAGYGKRLLPLTENSPKPLLKVGDTSLIERNIEHILNSGISEIVINISYLGALVREHVIEKFPNENINFSVEEKPLGTGGGVYKALPLLGSEPFLCMNADLFHNIKLDNLFSDVESALLIGVPNPEHNQMGDFSLDKDIVNINTEGNDLTWSGISIINPRIFKNKYFESTSFNIWESVLLEYIKKKSIKGIRSSDLWIDVGTLDRLKLANTVYNDQN